MKSSKSEHIFRIGVIGEKIFFSFCMDSSFFVQMYQCGVQTGKAVCGTYKKRLPGQAFE
jgi:hypothetical protein